MKLSQEHKEAILATRKKTREKRKLQTCKVFELKIDESYCNQVQSNFLYKIFVEAKWFYNQVISSENPFDTNLRKLQNVDVMVVDHYETRQLEALSSQMKVGLHVRITDAITILSKLKQIKFKVGRLKFKPEITTIDLPQHKITWKFVSKNRVHLQGCKGSFRVHGVNQIPEGCDFANAKLVRKASGHYLHITTFVPIEFTRRANQDVGLDFGIKTAITTSDGEKFDCKIPESKKLKRLQMHKARKKKRSRNNKKIQRKINREYEHINNQKKDFVCKTVTFLVKKYDTIYIQDELIRQWHKGLFGKQVQHSVLGAIKTRLKRLESTQVIAAKHPTTKMCYKCLKKYSIGLDEREYHCPSCGLVEDRDVKAAKTVLLIGQNKISLSSYGTYEYTCGEDVRPQATLGSKRLSPVKQEAPIPLG